MIAPLTLALIVVTSLAMTTSLVVYASDARESNNLKPCTNELTIGCNKSSEPNQTKNHLEHQEAANPQGKSSNETKSDPIVVLMDEISRLKQELIPAEASAAAKTRRVKPASLVGAPVAVSNQPASRDLTVCEKSLAVGTLGYRILCQPNKKALTMAHQNQTKQKQQSHAMTQAAMTQERSDVSEQAEASELRRLKSLFEQLDKRGNFRPIVQSTLH